MKLKAYVGIIINQGMEISSMKFVTGIEGRIAKWEAGGQAKPFSLAAAKDIAMGLNMNGFYAAVVQLPDYMKPLVNPNH